MNQSDLPDLFAKLEQNGYPAGNPASGLITSVYCDLYDYHTLTDLAAENLVQYAKLSRQVASGSTPSTVQSLLADAFSRSANKAILKILTLTATLENTQLTAEYQPGSYTLVCDEQTKNLIVNGVKIPVKVLSVSKARRKIMEAIRDVGGR